MKTPQIRKLRMPRLRSDLQSAGGPKSSFPVFKSSLAQTKAGTKRTVINCVGDSTTCGDWGGTPSSAFANSARKGSYPYQLQNMFQTAMSLPFAGFNIFGNGGGTAITSTAQLRDYYGPSDTAFGNTWGVGSATTSLGGSIPFSAANTTTVMSLLDAAADTVEVYYPKTASLDTGLLVVTDITVGTISLRAASVGVGMTTVGPFAPKSGGVGVQQGGNASGSAYVLGLASYASGSKGVAVYNAGWAGSSTADWTSTTQGFDAIIALPLVPADITIINLGINDWQNGVALATYQANLNTIANAAKANKGGDILWIGPNRTSTSITPQATQDSYVAAMQSLALSRGEFFFDIASIPQFANYATANAAGLMGDVRHPNAAGYLIIMQAIYNILAAA